MDQPTAEDALARLAPLVGEWEVEARPPDGAHWGAIRASVAWAESGAHLIVRSVAEPPVPSSVAIIGCDAARGTYSQLYSDERGVCRIYEMTVDDHGWTLHRDGEPFAQRFTATFDDDGAVMTGRWERSSDGRSWDTDFDVVYRRVPR